MAPRCTFYGPEWIWIGERVRIEEDSVVDAVNLAFAANGGTRVRIGDGSLLGRTTFISAVNQIEIGQRVLFAQNVYLADSAHQYANVGVPIMDQGFSTTGGAVVVEDGCWLGRNVVVVSTRGELRIGRGSVVGANSLVRASIPEFSVVAGNPAEIIRMYDPCSQSFVRVTGRDDVERVLAVRETLGMRGAPSTFDRGRFHALVPPMHIDGTDGRSPVLGLLVDADSPEWTAWLAAYLRQFGPEDGVILAMGTENPACVAAIQRAYQQLVGSEAAADVAVQLFENGQRAAFLRAVSALLATGSEVQVLESLACGTPVICANSEGLERWVGGTDGALIDDAPDRLLDRAAKQTSQLALLGAAGRERVERVYGIPWLLTGERRGYVTG